MGCVGISVVMWKLIKCLIVIIGLGGMGVYVLDYVVKILVDEIYFFDGDVYE